MRTGLHIWNYTVADGAAIPTVLEESARIAEDGGIDQLTVMDHWFQMEAMGDPAEPMLEAYTTLGFLASVTSRIRLAPLVTGVTYRHPGLLAKTVTTLDVLSRGRAVLGIGAAWYEREHHALGVPYPALKERFERLEEALQIALQMWSTNDGAYEGAHYRLAETLNSPPATSRPHPPIMIGGKGEKKTLRLAAQYAQIVNLTTSDPDQVVHLLEVLRRHCDDVGTDYDAIEKQVMANGLDRSAPDFLPTMQRLGDAGVQLAVFGVRPQTQRETAEEIVRDVVPALAAL
ncbi:LLM class F420-dependent oxidoreductase [Microbacterium sp. SORGH_AS_0888]|uniref:LLM class F420-dependent oxidoreductase n=1 Tax=Microbacterium sp. SORGH_AS_0888 TaxID=3041791 RepID=UPI0027840E46|nr:LLM class F420-dependent oxidoreductase [Microbacterium sp. SORGH_AS_0888]MDQ1129685.1 F420-dependent oxidoreductase-like protein [Microbacterium sp. SORGH_AS_0888]